MDRSNFRNILSILEGDTHKHKVQLMRDFDPVGSGEVPDPYYGGEQGFQEVYDILDRTMEKFLDHLETEHIANEKSKSGF